MAGTGPRNPRVGDACATRRRKASPSSAHKGSYLIVTPEVTALAPAPGCNAVVATVGEQFGEGVQPEVFLEGCEEFVPSMMSAGKLIEIAVRARSNKTLNKAVQRLLQKMFV